jgi:hypothetical protein
MIDNYKFINYLNRKSKLYLRYCADGIEGASCKFKIIG